MKMMSIARLLPVTLIKYCDTGRWAHVNVKLLPFCKNLCSWLASCRKVHKGQAPNSQSSSKGKPGSYQTRNHTCQKSKFGGVEAVMELSKFVLTVSACPVVTALVAFKDIQNCYQR